jgi:serine/threonine protein phosphatase PrpC
MPFQCIRQSLLGGRSDNQDFACSFGLGADLFAVVCDGLGGYPDGGWAATTFAHAIETAVTSLLPAQETSAEQAASDWLQRAWELFCEQHQQQRRHAQAQTTFTLVWINSEFTLAAHAGDSRIYGLSPQQQLWCTQDHNLYQLGVMNGDIDPRKMPAAQGQHGLLYRCVSSQKPLVPTITVHAPISPGQAVLLCSDGLWGQVHDTELLALTRAEDADAELAAILQRAVQRGGARADNATAALILAT